MLINIPQFEGFYCSNLESIIDMELEMIQEERTEDEKNHFWLKSDYSDVFLTMAKEWFSEFESETLFYNDIDISLEWDSMTSPKEYNFQTDRIFAQISESDARKLFNMVDKERLANVIKERFTSYDGFISFYSNDLNEWLEKPLTEWDCNELGTLLLACLPDNATDNLIYCDFQETKDCLWNMESEIMESYES